MRPSQIHGATHPIALFSLNCLLHACKFSTVANLQYIYVICGVLTWLDCPFAFLSSSQTQKIECFCGMVLASQTGLEYYPKVTISVSSGVYMFLLLIGEIDLTARCHACLQDCALLHQKHLQQVICLERGFISLICSPRVQTIATQVLHVPLVSCFCVRFVFA